MLILLSAYACAQSTNQSWFNAFGGSKPSGFNSVISTSDGGYAAVGYTSSYGNGTTNSSTANVWLVKTYANGTEQWNRTYGGPLEDVGYGIVQTADGGYAIAGYETSLTNSTMMVWLLKTDTNGNMQWNKTYGAGLEDGAYSLCQTSDGGFIMTGFSYNNTKGGWDAFLLKTDAEGNLMWNQSYGGSIKEVGHCVEQTSDGGYIFAGYTESYGVQGGNIYGEGAENLWVVKTDANGTEQWNQTFGGYNYDDSFAVQQLSDDGYMVAGTTQSYYTNGTMMPAYDANATLRAYLIRLDANGTMLWTKTYGGNYSSAIFSMDVVPDGYVLAGTSYTPEGNENILVSKIALNGTGEWAYTYGGTKNDVGYSIRLINNGFVVAGATQSFAENNSQDGFLMTIGENGTGILSPSQPGQGPTATTVFLAGFVIVCVAIAALVAWKWVLRR
jgi:regulation of enolase protein 1 (concanavalin A-like superfamily)